MPEQAGALYAVTMLMRIHHLLSCVLVAGLATTAASADTGPVWIDTTCDDTTPPDSQIAAIKQSHARTQDVQLGKAAVLVLEDRWKELTAWDNDSSCYVTVHGTPTSDVVGIGRAILSQLPRK
jgi:hypothetical protein